MALLTPPDPNELVMLGLDLDVPDQMNRSVWSRRGQVVGLPGAEMWMARAAIGPLATEIEERPWRAFVFNMRGRQNHFHFPLCKQTHAGSRPLVNAAVSAGYSLPLDGMAPSTTILTAGQYMTVPLPSGHNRLVMLTADLATNGAGAAIAYFNVALGEVPANNAVVETIDPFIPVRNTSGRASMSWDNAVSGASFDLEEAL